MNETINVLGIDPGLASLGWGVLRLLKNSDDSFQRMNLNANNTIARNNGVGGYSIEHLAHGVVHTKANESLGNRLLHIEQVIDSIFLRYSISILSYEEQFFVKNVTSGLQVAHALGVVLLYGAKQGLKVKSYTPKEIKLQITGTASAKKQTITKFVSMQLGLDTVKVHHAADALGAAMCYCYKELI